MKKDNKGFSLVELIVVVLIMGILAVALTPQVLKWVNNSRLSNDKSLMGNVTVACQTAMTNKAAFEELPSSGEVKITITKTADVDITSGSYDNLKSKIAEYCGEDSWTNFAKTRCSAKGGKIEIVISSKGKVTSTYSADGIADYNSEIGD